MTSCPLPVSLKHPPLIPDRLLMGPGPSNASPRVLQAMSQPLLGHLHPEFTKIMDDVKEGIQYMFQTKNAISVALSGTGHLGMEAVMANLVEPGDRVLVAKNGIWGERAADMAARHDADVKIVEKPPGENFTLSDLETAITIHRPHIVFVTHGESSTGVVQPLEGIADICHRHGSLFAVDTVASIGGVPVLTDELRIDCIYTGSQKVLSAPPGTAPISFSDLAWKKIRGRKTPVRSFYVDMNWLANYWGCDGQPRKYHHTGPISSVYALREALAILCEETLENTWRRHQDCADRLHSSLSDLGLQLFVEKASARLPTVTTVKVPQGVDWKAVVQYCMKNHGVEIAGGLGPTAGLVWRVGIMGYNCTPGKVDRVVNALQAALKEAGWKGKL